MGTRSTVKFYSEFDKKDEIKNPIAAIYQQYDGHLESVGIELAEFLKERPLINGIGGQDIGEAANGMGCLAAQFVCAFKNRIGGLYMTSASDEQEYNYEVRHFDGDYQIKVDGFVGTPTEFIAMVEKSNQKEV